MRTTLILAFITIAASAHSQFTLQTSNTTADLRGIHSIGNGVAWASGTNGTVLRTEDGGYVWQSCSMPPGAEKLDFRGIQAFDANTAIVMSSGPGDQSRLYKTTDGCHSWKLIFTNPDKDGFWDAIVVNNGRGFLLGDPVSHRVVIYASTDGDFADWKRFGESSSLHEVKFDLSPSEGEGFFAASNSILKGDPASGITFVSGGPLGAYCFSAVWNDRGIGGFPTYGSFKSHIPIARGVSAGAFSVADKGTDPPINWHSTRSMFHSSQVIVAVGGDYAKPDSGSGTAAWSKNRGQRWTAAVTPPHGYRSGVAYDASVKTWITVGPNGTDISTDDGRNWRPLHPDPALHESPDADRNWNALSLPYVVGPKGRIGRLDDAALKH